MVCIQEETRWFVSKKKPDGLYPRTRPDGLMVCIQEEPDGLYLGRNQMVCIQEENRWFSGLYPGRNQWFESKKKPDGLYPRTRPDGLMVCIQKETRWLVSRKKPDGLYPGRNQMRCIQEQNQMV